MEVLDTSKLAQLKETAAAVSERVSKVALLYGGTSGEREVSIASGNGVREVLEAEGFEVAFIDTGEPGFIDALLTIRPDVAFIALHGRGGEDGCIQGFLETLGIPYTHSGVEASALAMDKRVSKLLYQAAGLSTAAFITLNKGEWTGGGGAVLSAPTGGGGAVPSAPTGEGPAPDPASTTDPAPPTSLDTLLAVVGLPCVVKPVCDGSSLGVSIPKTRVELLTALDVGFAVSDDLLIEQFIEGTEVTVPVLGNSGSVSGPASDAASDDTPANDAASDAANRTPSAESGSDSVASPIALPVIEIVPKNEFYDYESKYAPGGSEHIIPARISATETALCQQAAIAAHRALGCAGVSRTDIIVTPTGDACLIETNTIPGMTRTSLIPEDAAKAGLTPGELYRLLLHYALERL